MRKFQVRQVLAFAFVLMFLGCAPPMTSSTADGVTTYSNPLWVTIAWIVPGLVIAVVGWSTVTGAGKTKGATEPTPGPDPRPADVPAEATADESKPVSPFLVRLIGVVIICAGIWFGVAGGLNRYQEKIAVSDTGARWTVGNWYSPERFEMTFDEVESIQTRQEESGFGRRRKVNRYADVVLRSGEQQTASVANSMLRKLWPDIVAKATAKGVRVQGDQFTD